VDTTVKDPLVGRVLDGRYLVKSRMARGGMATVYEAVDSRLDRTVALKVIRGGALANSDELQRFDKEATAAAQLRAGIGAMPGVLAEPRGAVGRFQRRKRMEVRAS